MKKILAGLTGMLTGVLLTGLLLAFGVNANAGVMVIAPDNEGALTQVVIHFTSGPLTRFQETYVDLLSSFSPDSEKVVVCRDAREWERFLEFYATFNNGAAPDEHYRPVLTNKEITPWARDRYQLAKLFGDRVLMAPLPETISSEYRENEFAVPELLVDAFSLKLHRPSFRFDGGDFTASRTVLYAGAGLLRKNNSNRYGVAAELRRELEILTGMKVVLLGEQGTMPEHHIGMFITPLDDQTVMVADPFLARMISDELPADSDFSDTRLASFQNLARCLQREGLRAISLPLVPLTDRTSYITYNNVLMEERDGERIVYLPVYGLLELDTAAREIYEREGFTVQPVRVGKIFRLGGSVRCLVNVLARESE